MHARGLTASLALLLILACGGRDQGSEADEPAAAPGSMAMSRPPATAKPVIQVWKDPNCGCCTSWIERLRAAGYPVEVMDVADIDAIKGSKGIPAHLASCHTALVDGYLVEGHVPVAVIDRILAERPEVAGVAGPGMPMGSEGMEMPGGQSEHYDVIAFKANGESSVYEKR